MAVTFAVGFPAGAAAMYGAQHGLDLETALAINNLRNFAYFLSLLLLGGSTLGFSVAALAEPRPPPLVGRVRDRHRGRAVASTPLAAVNLHDWGTLIWMVWFVGVGVLMLRHRDDERGAGDSAARRATFGHRLSGGEADARVPGGRGAAGCRLGSRRCRRRGRA